MNNRWGSHWRWRLAMLLLTAALLGYGWVLADQWKARTTVTGSDNPVALSTLRREGGSIEAYDRKLKKHWHVADLKEDHYRGTTAGPLRAVGEGKSVGWHDGTTIHVVDLAPPHEHRQYDTPAKHPADWFVGMTEDERFAVFQTQGELVPTPDGGTEVLFQRTVGGIYPAVIVHRIVDLKTGMVVDTRSWNSSILPSGGANEFQSWRQGAKPILADEPVAALWRISADGKWVKIEDRDPRFKLSSNLSLALGPQGHWRLLEGNEIAKSDERTFQLRIGRVSPSGEHALLFDFAESRALVLNTRTKEIREVASSYPRFGLGEFADAGEAIVWTDLRDDLRLFDIRTGMSSVLDDAGSQRRNRLVAVAAMLLLASGTFLVVANREGHFVWTLTDVFASFWAAQMAAAFVLVSLLRPGLFSVMPGARHWLTPIVCYFFGMFVGAATMMGIYWAFGRGRLLWRWLLGGLCLFMTALSVIVVEGHLGEESNPVVAFLATMAFGLLFAGAISCLGLFVRAAGWTLRDVPLEESPRQYRLATFFLVVAAIAVLIVVGKWLFTGTTGIETVYFASIGMAIVASGMVLAGILLSGARVWQGAIAVALYLLLAATGIYLHGEYPVIPITRYEVYLIDGPAALATAVTIAIPCLVLRSRGWRWRRGNPATRISQSVFAAA